MHCTAIQTTFFEDFKLRPFDTRFKFYVKGTCSRVLAGLLNKNILSAVKFINLQGETKAQLLHTDAAGALTDWPYLSAKNFASFLETS
jgi:hypothetical protein